MDFGVKFEVSSVTLFPPFFYFYFFFVLLFGIVFVAYRENDFFQTTVFCELFI